MLKRVNKKAQGLSTNAIILIILGVVVLAVLIIGFTIGWGNLAPWISTDNVDTIIQQCSVACSTNSVNDFCVKERTLKQDGEELTGTCFDFLTRGVNDCPEINCLSEGEKEYVWVNYEYECVDKTKGERIVGELNCAGEKPDPGICCERNKV